MSPVYGLWIGLLLVYLIASGNVVNVIGAIDAVIKGRLKK